MRSSGSPPGLALYFFFALFPILLLLLILLGKSAGEGSEWRRALGDSFKQVLPPDASLLMTQIIQQLSARAVFGTGAILAAVYAGWGALNRTWAMITGLNKAYEVEEKRLWWRVLFIMFALTISLSALGLTALAAIVYGNRAAIIIGQHLGTPARFEFVWRILQWAVIVIVLLFSSPCSIASGRTQRIGDGNGVFPVRLSQSHYGFPLRCFFGHTRSTLVLQGSTDN
jgi:membrane protein